MMAMVKRTVLKGLIAGLIALIILGGLYFLTGYASFWLSCFVTYVLMDGVSDIVEKHRVPA